MAARRQRRAIEVSQGPRACAPPRAHPFRDFEVSDAADRDRTRLWNTGRSPPQKRTTAPPAHEKETRGPASSPVPEPVEVDQFDVEAGGGGGVQVGVESGSAEEQQSGVGGVDPAGDE